MIKYRSRSKLFSFKNRKKTQLKINEMLRLKSCRMQSCGKHKHTHTYTQSEPLSDYFLECWKRRKKIPQIEASSCPCWLRNWRTTTWGLCRGRRCWLCGITLRRFAATWIWRSKIENRKREKDRCRHQFICVETRCDTFFLSRLIYPIKHKNKNRRGRCLRCVSNCWTRCADTYCAVSIDTQRTHVLWEANRVAGQDR